MKTRHLVLAAALLATPDGLGAQSKLATDLRRYREQHEREIVRELVDLLAIPNLASNDAEIRRNAGFIQAMLERRGITARLLESEGSPPAVYGELATPGARRTVVFYAHYDGQPIDSTRWLSPPWKPVLRSGPLSARPSELSLEGDSGRYPPEARIFARSASDDKSPIVAMLVALDGLKALGVAPSVNLKFFFEGEEEAGSDHLGAMLARHRDLLAADFWIFGDGPVHQSRAPQIVFGVRGVIGAQLTIYGPTRPLHSGHYGNWAPNPNVMMTHLLASMRDEEGRITIPGFYRDVRPLTAEDRKAIATIPRVDRGLEAELQLGRTEGAPAPLAERIMLPALNVSGLSGGRAGDGGANVVVPESQAYLDFRLVPDQSVERVEQLVEEHIARRGYHIVRAPPDSATRRRFPRVIMVRWAGGYRAARTGLGGAGARALLAAADQVLGRPAIRVPTLGGSLPLFHFEEVLRAPFAIVPIVNHDNNQHGENENLRLQNLWDGIELYGGIVARMGREWDPVP
jgi:acetylornithine deacetylase/succinyl-diaminopimelate desuccinylase-like protein